LKRCLPATHTTVRLSDDDSCCEHSILNTLLNAREFREATVRRGNIKKNENECFTLFGRSSWMQRKGQEVPNLSRKGQERKYTTFAPGFIEIEPLWSGQETDTEYFHGIATANPREDCRLSVCFEDGPSNYHWRVEDVEQTAPVLKMKDELLELLENARKCGSVVLCSPQETNSKTQVESDDQRSLDNTTCGPPGRCRSCDENVSAALTKTLESETERTQKVAQVQTGADRQDGLPTCGEDLALPLMSTKHPDLPMSETEICDLLTYGYVCCTCGIRTCGSSECYANSILAADDLRLRSVSEAL
jgi:hypothetical protein